MKLPTIPLHWSWKTVSNLGGVGRPAVKAGPFGSALKKSFYVQSGFRVYGQEQVIAGNLSVGDYYIDKEKFRSLKACEVKAGDILVSLVGTFGKVLVVPDVFEPGIINPRLVRLSLDPNLIDPYFFSRFFRSPLAQTQMELQSHGGTMDILNAKNISELFVPLPPLDEQRRIAAILDKADAVRRKRKEAIALTEELLRSAFLEMFGDPVTNPKGWEMKRLDKVCNSFQNGIGKNKEYYGQGTKVANISDLYEWHCFTSDRYSLLDVTPQEVEKYKLNRGDLLFVRSSVKREGVAVCSVYDSDETCLFSSFMIRAVPNINLANPEFLALLLRTPPMRKQLIAASNTSTITNIAQPGLANLVIPLPPIETQAMISEIARKVKLSVIRHKNALAAINDLFNSLLQRAFRGEL